MGPKVRYRVSKTYIACGDGQVKFSVPPETETVEEVVVAGRKLKPGLDYKVEGGHSLASRPEAVTLNLAPKAGDNIHIAGIIWKSK